MAAMLWPVLMAAHRAIQVLLRGVACTVASGSLYAGLSLAFAVVLAACSDTTTGPRPLDPSDIAIRRAGAVIPCGGGQMRAGLNGTSVSGGASDTVVTNGAVRFSGSMSSFLDPECCPYGVEMGECAPYNCEEGWIGHEECDPWDCEFYPDRYGCGDEGGGNGGGGSPTNCTINASQCGAPPGVPADLYGRLNAEEKRMCWADPISA